MSRRLIPCPSCERHVASTEPACPFCRVPRSRDIAAPLLALSALALAACEAPAPTAAAAPEATAATTSAAPAATPAATTSPSPEATDAGVPSDAGADGGPDAGAIDAGRPDASTMKYRPAAPRYGMPPDRRGPTF